MPLQISQSLEQARNPSLSLCPMSSPYPHIKAYLQDNTLASRKKVLPIIKDYLRDRERRGGCCGNAEDIAGEAGMDEDSMVPPTPMNSLVEGCPLDNGLPRISAEALVEKFSKLANEAESTGGQ